MRSEGSQRIYKETIYVFSFILLNTYPRRVILERSECAVKDLGGYIRKQFMYYIYILTNKTNEVMNIGVTNDLKRRLYEHRNQLIDGFTKKYNTHKLVYYETYENIKDAILREKKLKGLLRTRKNQLVETTNPNWNDLTDILFPKLFT